jgi:hypothetical protein
VKPRLSSIHKRIKKYIFFFCKNENKTQIWVLWAKDLFFSPFHCRSKWYIKTFSPQRFESSQAWQHSDFRILDCSPWNHFYFPPQNVSSKIIRKWFIISIRKLFSSIIKAEDFLSHKRSKYHHSRDHLTSTIHSESLGVAKPLWALFYHWSLFLKWHSSFIRITFSWCKT